MSKWLESMVKDKNVILLRQDYSCEMAEVQLNGQQVFLGNYWDYHPGCHGNIMPAKYQWDGREGFVNALTLYIKDRGKKVSVKRKEYKYKG